MDDIVVIEMRRSSAYLVMTYLTSKLSREWRNIILSFNNQLATYSSSFVTHDFWWSRKS